MPIGNLTSQIFANIYLNELDRFVVHTLKPEAYLRYGDDFIIIDRSRNTLDAHRAAITQFLATELKLLINPKHDILIKTSSSLHFLGTHIFPTGRRLTKRNLQRARERLKPLHIFLMLFKHCV